MPSKILSLLSPSCDPLAAYIKVIQNNKPAPATRSIHISILPSISIEKILNKNNRDQVLRARETRHLTQTLVFSKTRWTPQPGWGHCHLKSSQYRAFSHDFKAAISVFQSNKTVAILVSQTSPVGVELFMETLSFVAINLHRCWSREWKRSSRYLHISRNAPYMSPHPPPPHKFCITFVFHFSWVLQSSQEKLKTMLLQNFRGQIRCIMGFLQVV